jgi:hypothetical protein
VSDNESFIDEVTEEVRRDKLYGVMRRYGWIAILVIVAIVLGSVFREVKTSKQLSNAQKLGDHLAQTLKLSITNDANALSEAIDLIDSKSLAGDFLKAKLAEEKFENSKAIDIYENILLQESTPGVFKDFVKFKLLMLLKNNSERFGQILKELISPDNAFYLLALEQKIFHNINNKEWLEAITNLELLISDPGSSQALKTRALQLQKAINFNGS